MKLTQTPSAVPITSYRSYVHNCQRNAACELPYAAPIPEFPRLQVYAEFGTNKPVFVEIHVQDTCTTGHTEQIFASNYVVGQTPEGNWYGVFKSFNAPMTPVTDFVIWLRVTVDTDDGLVEHTYFSEQLTVEACAPLTKLKSCHPEDATDTGFDINGLYYGKPVNDDFLGMDDVRYFHIAWVRMGKVRRLPPKATFTSSLYKNFRTSVDRMWQVETELVPQWYADMLEAIYTRGAISVDDGRTYLVSDLAFEPLNDDDLTWKPFAQLKETTRLYYGCDESECAECCSPTITGVSVSSPDESASDSGSVSGSTSESPSASVSAGPTPGEGNVNVLANCGSSEHKITAIYWDPAPGGDPQLVGDLSDYPILPGESRTLTVAEFGTGDLDVQFDEDIFPLTVRIVDSEGNAQCGNSTAGPGTGNSLDFTGVTIDNTPVQEWSIELSCTPCE